jgi:hypothetical protein
MARSLRSYFSLVAHLSFSLRFLLAHRGCAKLIFGVCLICFVKREKLAVANTRPIWATPIDFHADFVSIGSV